MHHAWLTNSFRSVSKGFVRNCFAAPYTAWFFCVTHAATRVMRRTVNVSVSRSWTFPFVCVFAIPAPAGGGSRRWGESPGYGSQHSPAALDCRDLTIQITTRLQLMRKMSGVNAASLRLGHLGNRAGRWEPLCDPASARFKSSGRPALASLRWPNRITRLFPRSKFLSQTATGQSIKRFDADFPASVLDCFRKIRCLLSGIGHWFVCQPAMCSHAMTAGGDLLLRCGRNISPIYWTGKQRIGIIIDCGCRLVRVHAGHGMSIRVVLRLECTLLSRFCSHLGDQLVEVFVIPADAD